MRCVHAGATPAVELTMFRLPSWPGLRPQSLPYLSRSDCHIAEKLRNNYAPCLMIALNRWSVYEYSEVQKD